jgi:hypothetical protein
LPITQLIAVRTKIGRLLPTRDARRRKMAFMSYRQPLLARHAPQEFSRNRLSPTSCTNSIVSLDLRGIRANPVADSEGRI